MALTTRLLIAASVVLVAFLSLTGLALDRAFRDSTLSGVRDRLQAHVYMLLGAAEIDPGQGLSMTAGLPEARLMVPDSGLYALISDAQGQILWRSQSLLGLTLQPLPDPPDIGRTHFQAHRSRDGHDLFLTGFTVFWEIDPEHYQRYTFWVAESTVYYQREVDSFRFSLWTWLLGAAGMLLVVQVLVVNWTLRPLRQVAREIRDIEAGQRTQLSGHYPRELQPLTANLNQLVREGRNQLERYRNALGDLAHSLKTPLAVLRSATEQSLSNEELHQRVKTQVQRMNQTVDYQLQRAAASGRSTLRAPIAVSETARKIRDSLLKVYADKALEFTLRAESVLRFQGDEGDLLEILGNLADNACKWADQQVSITLYGDSSAARLTLVVEDDGPGMAAEHRQRLLQRWERGDEGTPGHGIGLAVVRNLVEEVYHGQLLIDHSALGGARITAQLNG